MDDDIVDTESQGDFTMVEIRKNIVETVKKNPLLCALLFIELSFIVYYNLFEHKWFLGYDASVFYLQVAETWKHKSLFLENFAYTTGIGIAGQLIPASILYGILGNVFLAVGLSNLIFIGLYITILVYIMKVMNASRQAILLLLCLLFAPYISTVNTVNCLDYFCMMYFSFAPYLPTIITILYFFLVHYRIHNRQYNRYTVIHVILCYVWLFLQGISMGLFIFVLAVVPVLIYYAVYSMLVNIWNKERLITGIFLIGTVVVSLMGKYVAECVFGFIGRDSMSIWVSLGQFWDNFQSIFTGYLSLTGALPLDAGVPILTRTGISFVFWTALSIGILVSAILWIVNICKQVTKTEYIDKMGLQVLCVCTINILLFILCYTTYGAAIFESRYLILLFIILCMFSSIWVDKVIMAGKNQTVKICFMGGIVVCLMANIFYSYYNLELSRNDYTSADSIISYADKFDVPVVYMPYDNVFSRNIRVLDLSRVYKTMNDMSSAHGWGDYTYYEDAGEYQGVTMLVCTQEFYDTLEPFYKSQYELQTVIQGSTAAIYLSDTNPVDMRAGIVDDYSIDYFYTNGICRQESGSFDNDGGFVAVGTDGYATWGPYTEVHQGTYEFTLHYETVENPKKLDLIGKFDVAVNAVPISEVALNAEKDTVTLKVTFDETQTGGSLEYRVLLASDVTAKLKFVEIRCIQE